MSTRTVRTCDVCFSDMLPDDAVKVKEVIVHMTSAYRQADMTLDVCPRCLSAMIAAVDTPEFNVGRVDFLEKLVADWIRQLLQVACSPKAQRAAWPKKKAPSPEGEEDEEEDEDYDDDDEGYLARKQEKNCKA